jgi:hypothetical protein
MLFRMMMLQVYPKMSVLKVLKMSGKRKYMIKAKPKLPINHSSFRILILIAVVLFAFQDASAQQLKKVRVRHKIVAYDAHGKVIDSLTKNLKNQSQTSRYLDQVQVDMRQIELNIKKLRSEPGKEEEVKKTEQEKDKLLQESMVLIKQIQEDKKSLVTEYFIIVESFKNKKNAKAALNAWIGKGLTNSFIFHNKHRKLYYICAGMRRDYKNTIRFQFDLQKKGIDSWVYYWSE